MVRVISLEQAVVQGDSPVTIQWIIDWHRGALDAIERSKKPTAKLIRASDRHKAAMSALKRLAKQLASTEVPAQAA